MNCSRGRPSVTKKHILIPSAGRHHARLHLLRLAFFAVLSASLLVNMLSDFPLFISHASASPFFAPTPGTTTVQDFSKLGHLDSYEHGAFVPPQQIPDTPTSTTSKQTAKNAQTTTPLPSAEPAKMQAVAFVLDDSFVLNRPATSANITPVPQHFAAPVDTQGQAIPAGTTPLTIMDSNGRLELQVPRGSVDLAQAKLEDGTLPQGALTLQVSQRHGHLRGSSNLLGSYSLQVVDSQGKILHGISLKQPVTIRYHYTPAELASLELDGNKILLSWPDMIAAARTARQPTEGFVAPMTNDASAHTLTVQSTQIGSGTLDVSGQPSNQSPPVVHMASVQGNSGQLSYSYPLAVAPGVGGVAPQLQLTYSSGSTDQRHSVRSPSGSVGDGWSLALGSISMETYPSGSAAPGTWYFISGVGGVSDRMIPDVSTPNLYQTEHLSYARIQFYSNCFHVWDRSGVYYELGCSADSAQYTTDAGNTRHTYRWDINKMYAPYNSGSAVRAMFVSYLQESPDGGRTIRDAALKQIVYGAASTTQSAPDAAHTAGTVDFHYHSPGAFGSWADAYGSNYHCSSAPPSNTTLRCDDPTAYGSVPAPDVMSTLELDSVTSYVGDDSASSHKAYSYAFSYQDDPYTTTYYDPYSQVQQAGSGNHLLQSVTPTVYQNGTGFARKSLKLGYSAPIRMGYYDSSQGTLIQGVNYSGQTFWRYLNSYLDRDTGVGATISYQIAFNNTNGTPYITDGNNNVIDDRHDPVYCSLHDNDTDQSKHCSGVYFHADNKAWNALVVSQIQAIGKDSSDPALPLATTTYHYGLAKTGTGCNPISGAGVPTTPSQTDCVGFNWMPPSEGDWADYYHSEFKGFKAVYITSPSGNMTANYYYSTEGWGSPEGYAGNYTSGQLFQQDVYWGTVASDVHLVSESTYNWAGTNSTTNPNQTTSSTNACDGRYSLTYVPCVQTVISSRTTWYEGGGRADYAPCVQTDNTYDDYNASTGLSFSTSHYHHLLQTVTSSSNAPSVTKKMSYAINDQTVSGLIYYNVDKISHTETDDASGHVWQCQDTSYDEGRPNGVPAPAAGLPTTQTAYTDCSNQANTALKSYAAYDQYNNTVASVDAFGAANSGLYSSKGCTLPSVPAYVSASWTVAHYTECTSYDATHASVMPNNSQNVLGQSTSAVYDYTQGVLPTSGTDANGQTTTTSYSYDANGDETVQSTLPGATGGYSSQSSAVSTCSDTSTLPCYEIDAHSALYASAVSRTFYDSQGQAIETRTPLDASHDIVSFTVHNQANDTTFQSQPFRVPHGSGWIDPNGATDEHGNAPVGTITLVDLLGRPLAVKDAIQGSAAEPGVSCPGLSGLWTACTLSSLGSADGNYSIVYKIVKTYDANNHMTVSFTDMLGRQTSTQWYSAPGSVQNNITAKVVTQYNAIDKPIAVTKTDLVPQSGQTISSVATSMTYNDLGQVTSVTDPDRGSHTYTYDATGLVIKDVSGSHTIGTSYDLLGRVGCVQDAAPPNDGSGTCSNGSHPLAQNTYDVSQLGTSGSTDFPIGQLTKAIATTYYPDSTFSTVTQKFQRDQRGRAVTSTLQIAVPSSWNVTTALPTYQQIQTYNDANQPMMTQTTVGAQAGYTFSQAYDSTTGLVTGLSNNSVGIANLATQSLDLHGQISDVNFQTTTGTSLANDHFTYDGDLGPTGTTATWQSGSGSSGTIFSNNRVYDPVGNVISTTTTHATVPGQSNSGGSETETFCYDEQNQMVWAGNSGTIPAAGNGTCGTATLSNNLNGAGYANGYAYTHLGQLWQGPLNGSGATQQYLYCDSSHPHQVSGLYPTGTTCANRTGATYSASYDAWGNLTSRTYNGTTAQLSYNMLDELVQWNAGSTNQEWYTYDSGSSRVLRRSTTASGTNLTVYAFGLEEHVYDASGSNLSNTYYYSLNGRLIGKFDGTATQFFLTDELGSVLSTFSDVANTAVVLSNRVYGPYGNSSYSKGSMGTNKGFTGQYNDATGLDYYNARYYDPAIGQFLSVDTVENNMQGMDPYAYVSGNPETMADPTGHCPWCITVAVGAVLGGLIGGGIQLASNAIQHKPLQDGLLEATVSGVISGALIGLLGPGASFLGAVAIGAFSGAVAGAGTQLISNAVNGRPLGQDVLKQGIIGGATGALTAGLFKGAGKILNKFAGTALKGAKSKVVDAARKALGTPVGDFKNLAGKTVQNVIDRIPSSAENQGWSQGSAIAQGDRYRWIENGVRYGVRMHGPDPRIAINFPNSNAAKGWVLRVFRGSNNNPDYMDNLGTWYTSVQWKDQSNMFYNQLINDIHIPIRP